ncbi:hypothetical protein [Methylacidiphilum caldifontis]|uniref:hypothetical protein n=1 Tax=Methylacidiphilum caldifontis TaxID=2795386 RepID=UPI001F5DAAD8|nr:hypothetical protein [Methylacidiphilum caldifontis]
MTCNPILFIGINYWPEKTGIAVFNTGRCEFLAAKGYELTMITAFPYYPFWEVPVEYRGYIFKSERRNGVNILRSFIYVPKKVSTITRILHEASFLLSSLLRALLVKKPDILFIVSPPLGLGLSAFFLSKLWNVPYIFHVPDLQPDAARDLGMIKSNFFLIFSIS